MNRNLKKINGAAIAVLCGLLLGLNSSALAQDAAAPAPAAAQKDSQHGTGVLPPGVKLEPAMPAPATAKPFHFPKAATKTLPNGLRVFVVTDHRSPAVAARLVLASAGATRDPQGSLGVASMAANMLTQGTEKRTEQQIAQAIDFVGGSLSAFADADATYAVVSVVNKDLNLGIDLLSDVVLHPSFKNEELDRQRQQLLSSLQLEYSDPSFLAGAVFDRVVYGSSPYGLPEEGTPETVAKLDRDALVHFHDAYYGPDQALLAFAGDVTPEAAFALAEKYFGGWSRRDVPSGEVAAPESVTGLHFLLIDKPDAVQTQIRAGRPGIRRNSSDYIPLLVTNRIFGGGFNSRLNTAVRVQKGLTYGANSIFGTHKYGGDIAAGTFTRTEATAEAVKLVLDLIAKMSTGDVTPEEMNLSRDYLAGVYPIQSETAEQVADRILTAAFFELPADYNDTYPEKIRGVSIDQARALASHYFDARNLDVVLLGNVSQFRDAVKSQFPDAKWDEIPFSQLDLLAADLRRPKEAAPAAAAPEAIERGRTILAAAVEAAGGAALGKIDSLEYSSTGEVFAGPQGSMPADVKIKAVFPDHIHSEVKLPFGTVLTGFDGKAGWISSPQGTVDWPTELNSDLLRGADVSAGVGIYRLAAGGTLQAAFAGEEDVEGRKTLAVTATLPSGSVKLFFDPQTHLLAGARYLQKTPQGSFDTLQAWSDYRPVENFRFPFHVVVYRNGSKFVESTMQEIKVNGKIDAAIFSKPQ